MENKSNKRKRSVRRNGTWKGKNNKGYSKPEQGQETAGGSDTKYPMGSLNDVSWYTKYPELTYSTASIPYPFRPGMSVPTLNLNGDEDATHTAIPGVLAITWAPSFGYSSKASDPASIVAREMYSHIRQSFSSSLSVGAPDIMMYIGALDSVYAYIAALKRIYRVVASFSPDNYVLPNGLLKALGFRTGEINQLLSNRTRLFSIINELIYMSRKFTCPQGMDILNRHYWMGDNVYTDAPTINSQFYVFVPHRLYRFKLFADSEGIYSGGLEQVGVPWMGGPDDDHDIIGTMFSFGQNLLDTLAAWEDAYTINGYLSRAYEGVPNFVIDTLDVNDVLTPVFVPEVLAQIENSRTIPNMASSINLDVTQDVARNAILCDPSFQVREDEAWYHIYSKLDPIINVAGVSPTVADTLISTRLKWSLRSAQSFGTGVTIVHMYTGTEVVLYYRLIINDELSVPYAADINPEMVYVHGGTSSFSQLDKTLYLMQFDHHPQSWMVFSNGDVDTIIRTFPLFNVMNLTSIDSSTLGDIHRVCIYSELNAFNM